MSCPPRPRVPRRSGAARLALACRLAGLFAACLGAVLTGVGAQAQPLTTRFEGLSIADGLSQNTITAILQDRTGFLWVGTEGGLNRFDGYAFTVYTHEAGDSTSLAHSFVHALLEDRDGTLWVGTYGGGLGTYDPATDRFRRHPGPLPERVTTLSEGPDGSLWVGSEAEGLYRLDPATGAVTAFRHTTGGLSHDEVRSLAWDAAGHLWIATHGGGLDRLDPARGTFASLRHDPADPSSLPSDQLMAVAATRDGAVWVGTRAHGACRLAPAAGATGALTCFRHDPADPASLSHDFVHHVLEDRAGRVWLATEGGGLNLYDPASGGFTRFTADAAPGRLASNRLRTLYEDRSGVLWIGSWDRGLSRRLATPFALYRAAPGSTSGIAGSDIGSFAEDAAGNLWIGSWDAGLIHFDRARGTFASLRHDPADPSSLSNDQARSVFIDGTGTLWAGTNGGGLNRYLPERRAFRRYRHDPRDPHSLGADRIASIYEDRRGDVWFNTFGGGPCRYDRARDRFDCLAALLPDGTRLSGPNAYRLYEDRQGRLWVSNWGNGIDVVDLARGTVTTLQYDPDDAGSLGNNYVTCFFEDSQGRLWVGTYGGGFSRYDSETGLFARYTERDGLPNDIVYGILEDDAGRFWLSTNRGLSRFDPREETFQNFDVRDGLQSNEFNGGAFLRLRTGEMAFGGVGGFNLFHPDSIHASTYAPPVVLTSFRVFDRVLRVPPGVAAPIRLGYRENLLFFEYAALDFTHPEKNRYAYMLDGLDEGWIDSDTRRFAAYHGLRPGRYVLRIRGTNSDGAWSTAELALPIHIVPPFWMTAWFQLGFVVVVLGAVAGTARYVSVRKLQRQVERLEAERRLHEERERISRDLHDNVGAQVSNMISGIELINLSTRSGQLDRARHYLGTLDEDARATMRLLRETIWALHHERVAITEFRDQVQRFLQGQTRYRDRPATRCTLAGEPAAALTSVQALHLFRIAQEAIHNSLKHARADTLSVAIAADADTIRLEVRDDGTFRPPDPSPGGHRGIGLGSMERRARELGGTFDLQTGNPHGTTVVVTVPRND